MVDLMTSTHCLYKLIGQASQGLNIFQIIDDFEKMSHTLKQEVSRRVHIKQFLKGASCVKEPQLEFIQDHVKELGARIIQELLAGLVISPTFAYAPYEELEVEEAAPVES